MSILTKPLSRFSILYFILLFTLIYSTMIYNTILYYIIVHYALLYHTILYYTILYYNILYHTKQHCTTLHSILFYFTSQYFMIFRLFNCWNRFEESVHHGLFRLSRSNVCQKITRIESTWESEFGGKIGLLLCRDGDKHFLLQVLWLKYWYIDRCYHILGYIDISSYFHFIFHRFTTTLLIFWL